MPTERTVLVRLTARSGDFNKEMMKARAAVRGVRDEIDTTNDRTAWLAQSILGLGPALVPLGAAGVPIIAGLATQMTVAGIAAGSMALAFNGVGDGLKALNDYQLEPTAENMDKLSIAMEKIGPAGEQFVKFLDSTGSQFSKLGMTAREGAFPGMEEGITDFLTLLPQVDRIVSEVSEGVGELAANTGEALSGPRFEAFFDYLESDAKPILLDMGKIIGGFAEGIANMMVAFGPMTADFSGGFADMADDFAKWSQTLDSNDSFQSFLDYIDHVGPKALDFLASLIDALVGILNAAAPVGELLLPIFGGLLDVVGALARTPLGPVFLGAAAAMSIYGRAAALGSITTGGLLGSVLGLKKNVDGTNQSLGAAAKSFGSTVPSMRQFGLALGYAAHSTGTLNTALGSTSAVARKGAASAIEARSAVGQFGRSIGPAAGQVALLAAATSGAAESMGMTNTVTLALMGTMAGPWGGAMGAAVGAFLDLKSSGDQFEGTLRNINAAAAASDFSNLESQLSALDKQIRDLEGFAGAGDFFSDLPRILAKSVPIVGNKLAGPGPSEMRNQRDAAAQAAAVARAQSTLSPRQADAAATARVAAAESAALARGYQLTAAGAREAAMSVTQFTASMAAANDAMNRQSSMDAYTTSLLDMRDALKESGKTLDSNGNALKRNVRAGLATRAHLRGIASDAAQTASEMKNFDRRTMFLDRARGDFIKLARAAGMSLPAARAMAKAFGLLDRTFKPTIKEKGAAETRARVEYLNAAIRALKDKRVTMSQKGAEAAARQIAAMRRERDALRDKTIYLTTVYTKEQSNSGRGPAGVTSRATGGPVYATAPGETRGPKDDTIPVRLSHREWVQPVAAVDFYGEAFMEAVRTRTLPKPRGYSEGGGVGGTRTVAVAAPAVSVDGARVQVFIDGREVRAVVREELADRDDMSGMGARASV